MSSGLYYEGSGFSVPHHVINEKADQLKKAVPQFFNLDTPFKTGHYVIFRWAFQDPKDHKSSTVVFKVELWNLSSGQTHFRLWEMRGGDLLSDKELEDTNPFSLSGYLYAGWWQPLIGKALSQTDNKSLGRAVDGGLRDAKIKCLRINVAHGFFRLKNVMGKAFSGFEYDINVEVTDERKKVHKMRWLIYCAKDFSFCQLVENEINAKIDTDTSVQFNQEKEKLLLVIREELTKQGKVIKSGDWVADLYYIKEITSIKKGYTATVIVLFTNQEGNSKCLEVTVTKFQSQYEITNLQNLFFDFNTVEYLEEHGNKLDRWQPFSKKACSLNNPCIKKLVDIGLETLGKGYKVLEINKAECKVKRNQENQEEGASTRGFEYKIIFRVKEPNGAVSCQEWILVGNPASEDDFKLVNTRKIRPNRSLTPQPNYAEELSASRSRSPRSKSHIHDTSLIGLPSYRLNESTTENRIQSIRLPKLKGTLTTANPIKQGYEVETRVGARHNMSMIEEPVSRKPKGRSEMRKYVFNFKLKPLKKNVDDSTQE